jgi:hypothetical protein
MAKAPLVQDDLETILTEAAPRTRPMRSSMAGSPSLAATNLPPIAAVPMSLETFRVEREEQAVERIVLERRDADDPDALLDQLAPSTASRLRVMWQAIRAVWLSRPV